MSDFTVTQLSMELYFGAEEPFWKIALFSEVELFSPNMIIKKKDGSPLQKRADFSKLVSK